MTHVFKRWASAVIAAIVLSTGFFTAMPTQAQEVESESTSEIVFEGQIIELSSTVAPTTIVVRKNPSGEFTDYTVDITTETDFDVSMDDWMVGDFAAVWGEIDNNTGIVTADFINNISIDPRYHKPLNGWIDSIAEDGSSMEIQWGGVLHTVNITENTHLVGSEGPHGTVDDFEVGDRVRIRMDRNSDTENEALIIMILRRGPMIFNLARTRGFYAELLEIDTENNSMNVRLLENAHLWEGDVNNLVGVEGDEVTVTWDDNTNFRRKYMGESAEDALVEGDRLQIVGRVDDGGDIQARMIRDTDVFVLGVGYHVGEILSVDTEANTFTVELMREGDQEDWTINYTDETAFWFDREEGTESDLAVGLHVRVRGEASTTENVVEATTVAVFDEAEVFIHHPARLHQILQEIRDYFNS